MRGRAGQAFVVAPRASAEGDEGRKATGRAWASFPVPWGATGGFMFNILGGPWVILNFGIISNLEKSCNYSTGTPIFYLPRITRILHSAPLLCLHFA